MELRQFLEKFTALDAYLSKEKKFEINKLSFQLKLQKKSKLNTQKGKNYKDECRNKTESRNTTQYNTIEKNSKAKWVP